MNRILKYSLLSCGILALLVFIFWIIGVLSFPGAFDKHVTREETVSNFSSHEADIMYFSDLLLSKRPLRHEISLSIDAIKGSISLGMPSWAIDQKFPNLYFDFKVSSVDDEAIFLKELGWDVQTFKNIVAAFRKTNCKSAMTNDGNVSLEYKTGTWSSYGYYISSKPMDDSLRKEYEAHGIQILNDRVTIGRATAL